MSRLRILLLDYRVELIAIAVLVAVILGLGTGFILLDERACEKACALGEAEARYVWESGGCWCVDGDGRVYNPEYGP